MTVRSAWLLTAPGGQTREDTRITPLGTMAPEGELLTRDGVIAGGKPFAATSAAAMQVQIGVGRAVVQGTSAQGAYPVAITAPEVLTVTDGNAQFGRIDSVVLRVLDGLYDVGGQTLARAEIVQGEPIATPQPPNLPPATLRLWDIAVPAGTSAGTGGINWATALGDRRRYTAAYGGIIPPGYGSSYTGSYPGQYRDNGSGLDRWDGAAWRPLEPSVGWTPVSLAAGYTNNGNAQGVVRYRRINIAGVPHMQWRGGVSWTANGNPPNTTYPFAAALPAGYRPATLISLPIAAGGVDIKIDFQTGGLVKLIPSTGLTTWASLHGLFYPLDA
ncbi:hypothetical protein GCM10010329_17400 [Streptomyces spiroverticillatus]|uniref:Uncharacterized protein n=1 Tax=Streptomyces finlayi TaxID=67296 RepID=A0A918WTI5_9ACTN|nr:hypothetical protein [Streptomyces finlayi]GGZ96690.1 hypothetical protein GCM10010329_17400 [Streptomyces spiroverticillatus]GHC81999.1 hypothetical protein GCM10010334_09880 [Streptomyces finlayi]